MSGKDTFNFRECYELLTTNTKTFHRWLEKAGIKPQENLEDPRERLITKAEMITLAEQHGRTLPAWFYEEAEPPTPITMEGTVERLTTFQQQISYRFDQLDRMFTQMITLLQEIVQQQRDLHALPAQTMQRFDELQQLLREAIGSSQARLSDNGAIKSNGTRQDGTVLATTAAAAISSPERTKNATAKSQTKPTGSKSSAAKKKSTAIKGKKLPKRLVALRDVAGLHHVATEKASAAGKSGKITVTRGKWLVNSRWATEALDAQGQHDFYEAFHEREDFTPCKQCPHPLPSELQTV